jgi:hypothetical protein
MLKNRKHSIKIPTNTKQSAQQNLTNHSLQESIHKKDENFRIQKKKLKTDPCKTKIKENLKINYHKVK